jgi:isocitrate dehydrogenase kinase/phosphatase
VTSESGRIAIGKCEDGANVEAGVDQPARECDCPFNLRSFRQGLIDDRDDWEIAETFFNSVSRRILEQPSGHWLIKRQMWNLK